jgi:hypothetical protein
VRECGNEFENDLTAMYMETAPGANEAYRDTNDRKHSEMSEYKYCEKQQ